MAGGEENSAEAAKLTGLGKYFNSITIRGRANVRLCCIINFIIRFFTDSVLNFLLNIFLGCYGHICRSGSFRAISLS